MHLPVTLAPATVVVLDTGLGAHVDEQLWTGEGVAGTALLLSGLTSATSHTLSAAAKSPTASCHASWQQIPNLTRPWTNKIAAQQCGPFVNIHVETM